MVKYMEIFVYIDFNESVLMQYVVNIISGIF